MQADGYGNYGHSNSSALVDSHLVIYIIKAGVTKMLQEKASGRFSLPSVRRCTQMANCKQRPNTHVIIYSLTLFHSHKKIPDYHFW